MPGATEMLLGLGAPVRLVGRSAECDSPPEIATVPPVTSAPPLDTDSAQIDAKAAAGGARSELDWRHLRSLAPDIVITQDLCGACAPAASEVAQVCGPQTTVLSLSPCRLDGVLDTATTLGDAVGAPVAGRRLAALLRGRVDAVREASSGVAPLRVVCVEWLAPLYRAGHWIPDQVSAAGGVDPLGQAGQPAAPMGIAEIEGAAPELVLLMPCGWGEAEARRRAREEGQFARIERISSSPSVVVADANAHFSRPGPRVVEGIEWLSAVLRRHRAGSPVAALR